MVDFDYIGHDLNHYGNFLDGIQNYIQTCLHHTVISPYITLRNIYLLYWAYHELPRILSSPLKDNSKYLREKMKCAYL